MKVELTIAEAVKLAESFKLCYQHSRLSFEDSKRVRSEYLNLLRKIEDAETEVLLEREKRMKQILNRHD